MICICKSANRHNGRAFAVTLKAAKVGDLESDMQK